MLAARGVERALLAGWSYGAYIGVQWAARNPERALGVVAAFMTGCLSTVPDTAAASPSTSRLPKRFPNRRTTSG